MVEGYSWVPPGLPQVENYESDIFSFKNTRSYAALRAADLDWFVGPGYSLGRVNSGEKPWKTNLEPWQTNRETILKNHWTQPKTMKKTWNYPEKTMETN